MLISEGFFNEARLSKAASYVGTALESRATV